MKHSQSESWILEIELLSAEQRRDLERHLSECQPCQALRRASAEVEQLLRSAGELAPAAGFSRRWELRLLAQEAPLLRRWSPAAVGGMLAGLAIPAAGLVIGTWTRWSSPALLATNWLRGMTAVYTQLETGRRLLRIALGAVDGISAGFMIFSLTLLAALAAVWCLLFYRFTLKPERNGDRR